MKTLKNIFFLTMAVALLASCETSAIRMNTEIHEDGTCVREVLFHTDSASLVNPNEESGAVVSSVLTDDKWQKNWYYEHPTTKERKMQGQYPLTPEQYQSVACDVRQIPDYDENVAYKFNTHKYVTVQARREFQNVEEMANEFPIFIMDKRLKSQASLTKKFRWFYTDYVYTESFESIAPQFELSLYDFLEKALADYWLTGSPNIFKGYSGFEQKESMDQLEDKFFQYINANMCYDRIKLIADHYDLYPTAPMTSEELVAKGHDLIANHRDQLTFNPMESKQLEKVIEQFLGKDVYSVYHAKYEELDTFWQQRMEVYCYLICFSVDYHLSMPGGIVNLLECSNGTFQDGELHFKLDGIRLLAPNYTIQATSSVKNDWALWLSVLIGLIALALLISTSRLFVRR